MASTDYFKRMFQGAHLEIDDLLLLESFQIAYLPGWVPDKEFARVLHARPEIKRFLVARCPEITGFIDAVCRKHTAATDAGQLAACGETVVWTIADLLVYNKCPEVYGRLPFHQWDFAEITSVVDLTGKVVIDAGAGTGRVALEAAETASVVYAVEPVSRLRQFIRTQARHKHLANLYVVDGFLHSLPFPDSWADVIITSHALGWQLENELREFERVAKTGATIIHCPGTADGGDDATHQALTGPPWGYEFSKFDEPDPATGGGMKRKYWKRNRYRSGALL